MPMLDPLRITVDIPDDNTCEAIYYGSAYEFAKSSKFFWDMVEDHNRREIEDLKNRIIDRKFASYVCTKAQWMIFSRRAPVSEPDKIRDLWTLRQLANFGSSIEHIDVNRQENLMWCSMKGVSEYCKQLMASGEVDEKTWKSASDPFDCRIEWDTVRAIRDHDEKIALEYAQQVSEEEEERKRQIEQFEREYAEYLDEKGYDESDEDENIEEPQEEDDDDPLSALRIFHEYETPGEDLKETDVSSEEESESEGEYARSSDVVVTKTGIELANLMFHAIYSPLEELVRIGQEVSAANIEEEPETQIEFIPNINSMLTEPPKAFWKRRKAVA